MVNSYINVILVLSGELAGYIYGKADEELLNRCYGASREEAPKWHPTWSIGIFRTRRSLWLVHRGAQQQDRPALDSL